jgi:hypothetical protein
MQDRQRAGYYGGGFRDARRILLAANAGLDLDAPGLLEA